ncbi:MAG: hypothetical protein C3F02_03125 [Parcubacteria group bacterium]|nr:MAG: hypothetical protein C3F02_03125 [Parcubacteria group bacterium]
MKKNWITILILLVLVGGGAFYGGFTYAKTKNTSASGAANFRNLAAGQGQRTGRANGFGSGGFINGNIIAKDDKSITVKLQDGGSKIVFFSGTMQVMKSVAGTKDDLQNGQMVMVTGKTNTDGTINADNVQIRPNLATSTLPTITPPVGQ